MNKYLLIGNYIRFGKILMHRFKENIVILNEGVVESFWFEGIEYPLFLHKYNCGINVRKRLTERSLEIPIAELWVRGLNSSYTEIGAVTPYYTCFDVFPPKHIIDPADTHQKVDIRKSLFDCDLTNQNILSISTLEHVGTGEYGQKNEKGGDSQTAIYKVLKESNHCLVSVPLGYNRVTDDVIDDLRTSSEWCKNIFIYNRSEFNNRWSVCNNLECKEWKYGPSTANSVAFVIK